MASAGDVFMFFHWLFSDEIIVSIVRTKIFSMVSSCLLYGADSVKYKCFWYLSISQVERYWIQFSWYLFNLDTDSITAIIAPNRPTITAICIHDVEYPESNGMSAASIISAIWRRLYYFCASCDFSSYHFIWSSTLFSMYSLISKVSHFPFHLCISEKHHYIIAEAVIPFPWLLNLG